MTMDDGKRLLIERSGASQKVVSCTRWTELVQNLVFHAELAEIAGCVTEFRLLNGADPVMVGLGDDNGESLNFAKEVFKEDPAGEGKCIRGDATPTMWPLRMLNADIP